MNTISTSEMLKIYAKAYKEPPYGREVEGTVELLEKAAEELEKYHSLEEQGLLLRLPCKVGDTVWVIVEAYSFGEVGDKPKSWYSIRTENFRIKSGNPRLFNCRCSSPLICWIDLAKQYFSQGQKPRKS